MPAKGVNATPTVTEQGFADTMAPEKTYHSQLSDEEMKQYEGFFADPRKPPDPEFLRKWFHEKTGAYLNNADDIVKAFKSTGQYNTAYDYVLPTTDKGAVGSYGQRTGNALLGDYGAEISAPFGALGLGSKDRPNV